MEQDVHRSDADSSYPSPEGVLNLAVGKIYVINLRWKVLKTVDYDPWIYMGDVWIELPARFAGETRQASYPYTAQRNGDCRLRLRLFSVGSVALDDIVVTEGGAGPWRRDFENGIVVVNPLLVPATMDARALAGERGRTGIRRIKGTKAPEVNSGAAVTGGLTLGPLDAIVLLADPIAAPPGSR